jgi:hypothetical protein
MRRVHQVGVIISGHAVVLVVAFEAVLAGNGPIADDDLAVTLVATEIVLKDDRMIKTRFIRAQVFPDMAVRAAGDLGVVLAGLEMADEAAAFRHRDVVSLDDLGMTARAAQLLAPSQVS